MKGGIKMRKFLLLVLISTLFVLFTFLFFSRSSVAIQEEYSLQKDFVPNEVLVKFKKDLGKYFIKNAIDSVQGKIITYLGEEIRTLQWNPELYSYRSFLLDSDLFHLKVPEAIGTDQAIYLLNLNPNVEYAERNMILHLCTEPNDGGFKYQWGLHNEGNEDQGSGTFDADIDAPEAWDIFTGSSDIVVAVIDTGVDYMHDDLELNIWKNPGESGNGKETDGIDNDGNGYEDDFRGWNFAYGNNNPWDDNGHGTHCSGIIGAVGNNNSSEDGIAGINWNVKIMALKSLNNLGGGDVATAIHAIDYATNNGAHLSNNSYAWNYDDADLVENYWSLYGAINRAKNAGKLFIAAAGNTSDFPYPNNDYSPVYPASYDLDNIIAVSATDHNDCLPSYSHYGVYSVDLGAPGGLGDDPIAADIYSTVPNQDYGYKYGTSFASPHVAGVAALVMGDRPSLSWWQLKTIIMDSTDPKSSLYGKVRTGGRLNAYNAITESTPDLPAAPSNLKAEGYCFMIKLTWTDNSNNEQGFKIYRKSGNFWYYLNQVGANVTTFWDLELPPSQLFNYKVRAYNQDGNSPASNADGDRTLPLKECGEWWK